MAAPKLRFTEFVDKWTPVKLGDISNFSKGKNISKSDTSVDGKYECIRYGELYTVYGETITKIISKTSLDESLLKFSEFNDVIIPASGETQIDIATASCVLKNNVALGGDLNIIKTKENGVFLSYYLNSARKHEIAKLAQGNSVVHLYASQLQKLAIKIPTSQEQQKIADFLQTVDKRIALLKEKKELLERYKKGIMDKIFSQVLRFKDNDGIDFPDWTLKTLKEICLKMQSGGTPLSTNSKYYNGEIPFLSIADMTMQGKYLTKTKNSISEEGLKNSSSWLVPTDSIIYSMYASVGFVSINKISLATSQAVLNIILKKEYYNEYIYYYLSSIQENLTKYITTGTQGNLNAKTITNFIIPVPEFNEQKLIANFLAAIDKKIYDLQSTIDGMETWKKELMEQMFV